MTLRHVFLLAVALECCASGSATAQAPRVGDSRTTFIMPNGSYLGDQGNGNWGEYSARGLPARQFQEVSRSPAFVVLYTIFPEPLYVRLWNNGYNEYFIDRPGGAWVTWQSGGSWSTPPAGPANSSPPGYAPRPGYNPPFGGWNGRGYR